MTPDLIKHPHTIHKTSDDAVNNYEAKQSIVPKARIKVGKPWV